MARLATAPWPGNVRELLGVAERLVVESTGHPDLDVEDFIRRELGAVRAPRAGAPADKAAAPPASGRASGPPKREDITLQQLLEALARARWNKSEAARDVRDEPPDLLQADRGEPPRGPPVLEIPYDDIVRDYAACGGDAQALAKKLGIPAEVLCRVSDARAGSGRSL